jgi:hypothetical protein
MRRALLLTALAGGLLAAIAGAGEIPASGTIDLADAAALTLFGDTPGDQAGWAAAAAGDVNGDGKRDLLIGAPKADPGARENAGSTYVVFGGGEKGSLELGKLGDRGFRIDGARAGDQSGFAVSGAGDVNGDGRDDLLVGAPRLDAGGDPNTGAAYVVFGHSGRGNVDLGALGSGGYRIAGATAGDLAGVAVASVGDLNGDGRPEAVIGASGANPFDRPGAGAAHVVFGRPGGGDVDLANPGDASFEIAGKDRSRAGLAVGSSPDMNGDGRPEILVGAPIATTGDRGAGSGEGYVVWGPATAGSLDLAAFDGQGFTVRGGSDDHLGVAAAPVGDLNEDGRPDVAFGAPFASAGERSHSGSLFVVFGRAETTPLDAADLGSAGARLDGAGVGDLAGAAADSAGDFNGDGHADVVVSAPYADTLSREESGTAYVVFGPLAPGTAVDLGAIGNGGVRIAAPSAQDVMRPVAGVGDATGDGTPDILTGQYRGAGAEMSDTGSASLVEGVRPKPPPPPPEPDSGADEEVAQDKCVAATNIEVVIDDSGSMIGNDPDALRSQAVELLVGKPRNEGKVMGAIEFGGESAVLFPPQPIEAPGADSNQDELRDILDDEVVGDNGSTNFNSPFAVLKKENPGAKAIILLTDGGHRGPAYENGHRGGPPVYAIGLRVKKSSEEGKLLARIADETKGAFFANVRAENIQSAINAVDSRLNCDTDVDVFVDTLGDSGDLSDPNDAELDETTNSVDVTVTWDDEDDEIEPGAIDLTDEDGDVLQRVSASTLARVISSSRPRRARGLTLRGTSGSAFFTVRISGVKARGLRSRVRARSVAGGRARVRTQVAESRRRR